jgi:3,2-trans-enoyl-CoA isomerase
MIKTTIKNQYAIITLQKEPVNSMNLEFWLVLQKEFQALESNPTIRGVLFKSGLERDIFTAGNDLNELYAPKTSESRFIEFWMVQNQFLAHLSKSKLVTVAALNGACPAGGTALGLACDFRIACADTMMGLNETALGISVPPYWVKLMVSVIGQGKTDKLVQFAQMVPAKECLQIGLVDQLVETRKELYPTAEAIIQKV